VRRRDAWPCCWDPWPATPILPTRSRIWTPWPRAGSTCYSADTTEPGGIGRHVQGSQIFDYWHDPDKLTVEHFTDGDLFDNTVEPGWAPLTASGLSQWGPRVTQEFLGAKPSVQLVRDVVAGLRGDNEITLSRLIGMVKGLRQ
jgi:hypothetical protein